MIDATAPGRRAAIDDRGDAGGQALVWMLTMVVFLGLVWLGIQVAFDRYGQSMAVAAAQAGVRAAATTPGDPSRAEPAVRAFISAHAASDVLEPQVTVSVDGTTVTVTVTARGVAVIPGTHPSLTGGASGPMEPAP